jgi:hypothetical protein
MAFYELDTSKNHDMSILLLKVRFLPNANR